MPWKQRPGTDNLLPGQAYRRSQERVWSNVGLIISSEKRTGGGGRSCYQYHWVTLNLSSSSGIEPRTTSWEAGVEMCEMRHGVSLWRIFMYYSVINDLIYHAFPSHDTFKKTVFLVSPPEKHIFSTLWRLQFLYVSNNNFSSTVTKGERVM
jgi:hypothetical protein